MNAGKITATTPRQFRRDWKDYNQRWLAWCWMVNKMPGTFRPTAFYWAYSSWITSMTEPSAPGVSEQGQIIDQEAFTEYLWKIADDRRIV